MIIGSGCESIAIKLLQNITNVSIILNDYDSLMISRLELNNHEKINCKMMDYANTDFEKEYFNLIYAQASLSVPGRKEILKEIKRVLSNILHWRNCIPKRTCCCIRKRCLGKRWI